MRFNVAGALAVLGLAATAVQAVPNPVPAPVAAPEPLLGINLGINLDLSVAVDVNLSGYNYHCYPLSHAGGIYVNLLGLIQVKVGGFYYRHQTLGDCYCWY